MPDDREVPDDPTIPDDSLVYRRITPEWYKVDPGTGERRLTSAAFSDLGGAMSVAVGIDVDLARKRIYVADSNRDLIILADTRP